MSTFVSRSAEVNICCAKFCDAPDDDSDEDPAGTADVRDNDHSVGRTAADSQGSTTNYDARGKVISRESTSGNTTTVYDPGGRNVGRVTTSRQGTGRNRLLADSKLEKA